MGRSRAKNTGVVVLHLRGIRSNFSLTAAKRGLLVVTLALMGAAGYVLAAPSTGETAPCGPPEVTVADYVALGSTGCTINDMTFSNFTYNTFTGGTGVAVPGSGVAVAPKTTGNPGFMFTGPFAVLATSSQANSFTQGRIAFQITTTTGQIEDDSLSAVQSGTGDFHAEAHELLCLGQHTIMSCPTAFETLDVSNQSPADKTGTFAPQSLVAVRLDLVASTVGGSTGNTAELTSATVLYSEVPEPATLALFGTGLLGLAGPRLLRRKR